MHKLHKNLDWGLACDLLINFIPEDIFSHVKAETKKKIYIYIYLTLQQLVFHIKDKFVFGVSNCRLSYVQQDQYHFAD